MDKSNAVDPAVFLNKNQQVLVQRVVNLIVARGSTTDPGNNVNNTSAILAYTV